MYGILFLIKIYETLVQSMDQAGLARCYFLELVGKVLFPLA